MRRITVVTRATAGEAVAGPLVSDSFDRADSSTSLGTADTGQVWTPNSGTWGIDANRAYLVTATSQATVVVDAGAADCRVQVVYRTGSGNSGLCFRSTDDNNHFVVEGSNGTIYRRQAGTYTSIGSSGVGFNLGDTMGVVLSGSTIKLERNGTVVLTATDPFNATATRHGLRSDADTTKRFDDFRVEAA